MYIAAQMGHNDSIAESADNSEERQDLIVMTPAGKGSDYAATRVE